MGEEGLALLVRWANFYVITGSAAAALTGLQFVVIVLSSEMRRITDETNGAFSTPTIVHFCTVLLIAALLNAPWPVLAGVAWVIGLCGVAGICYAIIVLRTALRQDAYQPVLEDWLWHFSLPPIAYATLLIAAIIIQNNAALALFLVGGAVLLLLFIGIHNAWDSVVFVALQLAKKPEKEENN